LRGLRHCRDLGEDVDAVLLVLDHALQPAGLALDPPEPAQILLLAADVPMLCLIVLRLIVLCLIVRGMLLAHRTSRP
jgi:hypothetical protein